MKSGPSVPCGLLPRRKRPRSPERCRPCREGSVCAGRPPCRRSAPVPVLFWWLGTATRWRRPCPIGRHRRVGRSRRASGRSARCGLSVTWSVTIAVRVSSSGAVMLAGRTTDSGAGASAAGSFWPSPAVHSVIPRDLKVSFALVELFGGLVVHGPFVGLRAAWLRSRPRWRARFRVFARTSTAARW